MGSIFKILFKGKPYQDHFPKILHFQLPNFLAGNYAEKTELGREDRIRQRRQYSQTLSSWNTANEATHFHDEIEFSQQFEQLSALISTY